MAKENSIAADGRRHAVLKYAKKQGYKDVIYRGKWKKKDVYEMILDGSDNASVIGLPQYIMDDDKKLQLADVDQIFKILDKLDERAG